MLIEDVHSVIELDYCSFVGSRATSCHGIPQRDWFSHYLFADRK